MYTPVNPSFTINKWDLRGSSLHGHVFVMPWQILLTSSRRQGQLLEGVECHIYLYCFTFDDINLNRAFVIIVLFPKKYSNKKACANDIRKRNALGIY